MAPLSRLSHREYSFDDNPFFDAPLHESTPYIPYVPPRPSKTYLDIKASPSSTASRVRDPYQPIDPLQKNSPLFLILLVAIFIAGYFYWMRTRISSCLGISDKSHTARYSASKASTCQKPH
ncbi:hypothetical protein OCU04_007400 [Sclerotinia nivalis]|uniref:Uncharacterized protein n=1 Tax=Sclerotinia nivalis TaxID=352851 RepID=A0A9X0DHA7_9HELO|nr:hypothetical protein OCU04_007400 [Sclerotinia nivalis]